MTKTILITGSTDGIGLETAKMLASDGNRILLHGRNPTKLADALKTVSETPGAGPVESYAANLSSMAETQSLAASVAEKHASLDVLINNAGVFNASDPVTSDGIDVRFAVNTLAPYLLTQRLSPLLGKSGRVINLSSAAQSPVDPRLIAAPVALSDFEAYAQSKLAITMWSREMAKAFGEDGPVVVAVNPGSLLATKMVKEAFGSPGSDVGIGARILVKAALSDEFASASGKYFDNDSGRFAKPHPDALDDRKSKAVTAAVEAAVGKLL